MNRQRRPSQPNPPKRCGTRTSKSASIVTASPGDSGCGNSTWATVRAPAGVSTSRTVAGRPSMRASAIVIAAGEKSPGYSQW